MFQLAIAALLQLSLAFFVEAAPVTTQSTAWQGPTGGGIVGFIVLVLDIIAWGMYSPKIGKLGNLSSSSPNRTQLTTPAVEIVKSNRDTVNKVIWALVVFLFPVVGMIIYYLFSNRKAHNTYEAIPS